MRVDATPLRVETVTTDHVTVQPAHTMPATTPNTYQNCTGHAAKRRKRIQRNNKAQRIITTFNNVPFRALSATHILPEHVHLALLGHAINPDTGMLADYKELSNSSDGPLWRAGNADEIGRLCDGHGKDMPTGTKTMSFIAHHQVPHGDKCTYLNIVAAYRPEKEKKYRIRWTVGGNLIIYAGDVTTKTAEMATAKILFNSVISTPGARFMTLDIKDFFLGTPMSAYEYMKVPIDVIPDEIMVEYNLQSLVYKGHVYVEIQKGMYGLPQAGRLANDRLTKILEPHGYRPCPITPGLWRHDTNRIVFTLVVDDFGIKYTDKKDVDHLMTVLQEHYQLTTDWEGKRYCGLTIDWDYDARTCDISMPGYIERALQRFQHPQPTRPQRSPHHWQKPNYGVKVQYADAEDSSPFLSDKETTRLQEILGTLL
jgi:hypothetical protein